MIGLMRLAWWREALERLDLDRPPAEPLLATLAHDVLPYGVSGGALAAVEDGWAALVDGEPDADAVARHGRERGAHLFQLAAQLLGASDPRLTQAGEVWALADLGFRHSQAPVREAARARARNVAATIPFGHWQTRARALAALYVLARADAHRDERAQGSPARLLRMLALRLLGR